MAFRLVVPRALYEAMVRQAREELPNECCGLLGGMVKEGVGRVLKHYPLVNEAASAPVSRRILHTPLFRAGKMGCYRYRRKSRMMLAAEAVD